MRGVLIAVVYWPVGGEMGYCYYYYYYFLLLLILLLESSNSKGIGYR